MNRLSFLLMAAALAVAGCGAFDGSGAGLGTTHAPLTQVSGFGTNPGNLSMYLYVPQQLPSANVAVVVAMHGCSMSASSYQGAGWNALAEQLGFIVIYPQVSGAAGCFGWFNQNDIKRDSGQALSIKQMVDYVKSKYPVNRAFVTGLSAGGAMTEVMLATYPDVFSAGAAMAGIPYACGISCMSSSSTKTPQAWGDLVRNASPARTEYPRVAIWHGSSDSVVAPVNGDESVTQWTNVNGLSGTPTSSEAIGMATVRRYANASGEVRVEYWKVGGMNHGTAVDPANGCGQAGAYLLDVKLCSSAYAAQFFGLMGPSAPVDAGISPQPVDAGVEVPQPVDAGVPPPVDAGAPPDVDAGMPPSGFDAGAPEQPMCHEVFASNYGHTQAGRAVKCTPYNGHACTIGANADIGLWSLGISSWVRETQPGFFEAGRCP